MSFFSGSNFSGNNLQKQFRLLAEEVQEYAIFLLDKEGRIISWNQGAEAIKGYREEEILGRHFSVFYPEEKREAGRPEEALRVAAREGDWTNEGWRVRKDGSQFWARVTVTALHDEANAEEEGQLKGFAKVTRDLTDRRRREEELKRQKEEADQAKESALQAQQQAEEARRRAERENALLRLVQEVTAMANEAESLKTALEETVRAVCDHIGWPIGHVYWRRPGEDRPLVSSNIWHVPGPGQFDTFRSVSEATDLKVGESLPDLVAEKGGPVWIEDVTENPNFVRARKTRAGQKGDLGVKSGFAVPVQSGEQTVAVLEFFSPDRLEQDEELLEVIGSVGTQLSRVAEREKARRALRRSERRYRHLFEDSLEGIAITTPEGEVLEANPAALQILGYRPEEIPDLNVNELYACPAEQKRVSAELLKRGRVRRKEVRFRRADEEEIICALSVTVRSGDEHEPKLYQTIFRDVTERKAAKEALEESEEKFRTLAEGALVGISLIQEGRYQYVNPELADILGYTREKLLGVPLKRIVHPADWPHVQRQIERRVAGEVEEVRYEARIRTKSGEIRHVKVSGSQVTYQGAPAAIATIQDVTEERRLQRELLKVQEEERQRIGQDLHDGVASQLTGASLMLDTLKSKTQEEHPDLAERIARVLDLVRESVEDLRRITRGLNPVVLEEGGLLAALERLAENTDGCTVARSCPRETLYGLDAEKEPHCYWIVQEAVANARRHGKAGEIVIRLRTDEDADEDALVLEVEDDGTGFDAPHTTEEGLGLRTMKYRSELLGADLAIDSAPEEGTTVRCRMPL